MKVKKLKHSPYLLPLRPYDISKLCDPVKRKRRLVKPKEEEEELQIENSDELRSLPESETQDEMSEATTTSTPPLSRSSVHEQSLRIAALALEKKKKKPAPMETKSST